MLPQVKTISTIKLTNNQIVMSITVKKVRVATCKNWEKWVDWERESRLYSRPEQTEWIEW